MCASVWSCPSPGHGAGECILFIQMMLRSKAMNLNQSISCKNVHKDQNVLHHPLTEEWEIFPMSQVWGLPLLRLMQDADAHFLSYFPKSMHYLSQWWSVLTYWQKRSPFPCSGLLLMASKNKNKKCLSEMTMKAFDILRSYNLHIMNMTF